MDWSENHSCIKCDKGGNVLVCSENGCPLTVHERCLGCPANLDDAGHFRCPYCVYKQAVVETRKAREHALARKRALLIFMDGSEKDVGENGRNEPKTGGSNVDSTSKRKSNNGGVVDQGFPVSEKIRNAEEDSESSAGSKSEVPSLVMNEENGNGVAEEKQVQEEEQIQDEEREASVEEEEIQEEERDEASAKEEEIHEEEREASVEEEETHEKESEASVEEEEIQEEEREASVEKEEREASADEEEDIEEDESETLYASNSQDSSFTAKAKRDLKRSKPVEIDPETVQSKRKLRKRDGKKKQASPAVLTPTRRSGRGSSSAMGTGKAAKKELVSPRKSTKPKVSPAKLASTISGKARRQRLLWTEEEETALREAAIKYARDEKIPWAKILEESKKFNESRTPEDLRDKWRKRRF